ncbi:GPI ethanolamine phosphate transferase 1 [Drosophila bipectinata]|uniref:GPI ethanolamine phosphate transferase 1 n=1 Tax=Drosophila bipectinata TaxID=42026 RepID=UPI001C890C79|nr:GPI ethanolamine phosphate transferase 1 [Drosophila bipectinata]
MLSYHCLILLQLILVVSVGIIYLRAPSLGDLEPQNVEPLKERPPADRLVILLRDGLSAQTFLSNRCGSIPLLQGIFMREGLMGVSRPETTTYSSLSPYVSLFTGYNENAAMVARGWVHYPTLDTIFKRCNRSYAWTTSQVLRRLPDMGQVKVINYKSRSAGTSSKSKPEQATNNAVEQFLCRDSSRLQNITGLVFFIHLTGVEPSLKTLSLIESNIHDIYKQFEKNFPDNRTAYLLTSNLGNPQPKTECKLAVESPFFLWGSGVAHIKSMPGRTFVANSTGFRLPLHVLHPPQITALMSALLGLPPPVNSRGILPNGFLNASIRYEANAMLTNARQLLAQARHLWEQHPSRLPAFWLDAKTMDSFLKNSMGLKTQRRFKAMRDYAANFMPVLIKAIDYYQNFYKIALLVAVSLAEIGWVYCVRCHLESEAVSKVNSADLAVRPLHRLIWWRAASRTLTGILVIYMLLDGFPFSVMSVLLLPSLYWMLSLKMIGKRPRMAGFCSLLLPVTIALICLGGFVRRWFITLGYLSFACFSNRDAFRVRGFFFYLWLLLLLGLACLPFQPESLGCSQPGALVLSILLTLLRPLACGIYHNLVTWLSNLFVMLVALEHVLIGWYPGATYIVSWTYLVFVAFWQRRNLQPSELMFFNLSTLYTLSCTSYEVVVIQMLALELQVALRMKLERNENIGPKTAAIYIFLYSWYSLLAIGSFPAFDDFLDILHESCLGHLNVTHALVVCIKLTLPWLLLLCILAGNYKDIWAHERQIFVWLLFMSNITSMVLLWRMRDYGPWREILSRFAEFAVVQVFPIIWLGLWKLAQLNVGSKWISQLPERAPFH